MTRSEIIDRIIFALGVAMLALALGGSLWGLM